jgi:putative transposase
VWTTKTRLPLIDAEWEVELYNYLWGKAAALECIPHAIGGMPDHIHVAVSIPPKLSVAMLIGQLKGASSHHINGNYAQGTFGWQAEYGVLSISEQNLKTVVAYVNRQQQHHAENTIITDLEQSPEGA